MMNFDNKNDSPRSSASIRTDKSSKLGDDKNLEPQKLLEEEEREPSEG
jgi:hypothetical protein